MHAFSDPDSNSGYLVTWALLAETGETPEALLPPDIFTYGHRNVVRAVASGLAQSGSVDGYVWDVVSDIEPDLAAKTQSAPPVRVARLPADRLPDGQPGVPEIRAFSAALGKMAGQPRTAGRCWTCSSWTALPSRIRPCSTRIAAKYDLVQRRGMMRRLRFIRVAWPLTVQVPIIVAAAHGACRAIVSQIVLQRLDRTGTAPRAA